MGVVRELRSYRGTGFAAYSASQNPSNPTREADRSVSLSSETKKNSKQRFEFFFGFGRGRIRTHGPREGTPVFKTGAFGHSATLPD